MQQGNGVGVQPSVPAPAQNWGGQVITTTVNPHQILPSNAGRKGWRLFNLNAATGRVGYTNSPIHAYIPLPADSSYPISNDLPCESNELWYHGAAGAILGVGEAQMLRSRDFIRGLRAALDMLGKPGFASGRDGQAGFQAGAAIAAASAGGAAAVTGIFDLGSDPQSGFNFYMGWL